MIYGDTTRVVPSSVLGHETIDEVAVNVMVKIA